MTFDEHLRALDWWEVGVDAKGVRLHILGELFVARESLGLPARFRDSALVHGWVTAHERFPVPGGPC